MKKSIAIMLLLAGMAVVGCGEKKKPAAPAPATPPAPASTPAAAPPAETPAK